MANATKRQWSDCLSVRDGHLYIEECNTLDLVKEFGSPLFVLSEQQLRDNAREFKRAFSKEWPHGEVDVLPAFKANSTLASRRILSDEGAGADIYSEGELIGVLKCGTQPERISVNGGGKSEAVIRRCIEAGVRITVEDLDEPELINRVAGAMGKTAKIRFRVKPDFPNLHKRTDFSPEYVSIDLGIQVYKSGIPAQYLPELGKKVLAMDHVELVGLHFHGGRHHQSLWYWRGLMKQYGALVANLCDIWGQNGRAFKLQELDIGGGYASHRDPLNKLELGKDVIFTWLTWPIMQAMRLLSPKWRYKLYSLLVKAMARDPYPGYAPSIQDYAQAAVGTFRNELEKRQVDLTGVRLQIEPGRGLYGNTGIHLASVKKVKKQTEPMAMTWVLTDTTYFFLAGGTYEYNFHDFVVANRVNDPACQVADIVGHSCYADRILPLVNIPDVMKEDVIALLETGAYQEVSASNFNALPRPATVLVNHKVAELIKRAETVDDVFARDT
ncbi:MAG: hypothetical protein GY809_08560, partial [Planctomycetes bacterium]|nr:hypothetical protein [Planctomycetota bacterium]